VSVSVSCFSDFTRLSYNYHELIHIMYLIEMCVCVCVCVCESLCVYVHTITGKLLQISFLFGSYEDWIKISATPHFKVIGQDYGQGQGRFSEGSRYMTSY